MRVQDTLTGTLVELPPPPEPIGIYVCGPTVYQRAHIGNARPFVVFTWLARWLRAQGHEVRLVHNITDVNDKIYEAAPGASAELAAAILEPQQVTLPEEARPTLTRFAELRASGLDGKDIVRELKAVGGNLKFLRLALTGAERGPELWTVVAAVPRDEALRRVAAAITLR